MLCCILQFLEDRDQIKEAVKMKKVGLHNQVSYTLSIVIPCIIFGDFRFPYYLHGLLKTSRMQLLKILVHPQFQMLI